MAWWPANMFAPVMFYADNVGWINLGTGFPTNGIQYRNLSANDFGVNLDSAGNLSGCAWGANIGWIIFTNGTATGALSSADSPRVNMSTGKRLGGYAYSANCGWISLSNSTAYVQTDKIAPGADLNGDGIPDAWEIQNFGTTNINVNADADGDGMSNLQEYYAGTNPNDLNDYLHITYVAYGDVTPNFTTLHWNSAFQRVSIRFNIVRLSTQTRRGRIRPGSVLAQGAPPLTPGIRMLTSFTRSARSVPSGHELIKPKSG